MFTSQKKSKTSDARLMIGAVFIFLGETFYCICVISLAADLLYIGPPNLWQEEMFIVSLFLCLTAAALCQGETLLMFGRLIYHASAFASLSMVFIIFNIHVKQKSSLVLSEMVVLVICVMMFSSYMAINSHFFTKHWRHRRRKRLKSKR